MVSTVKRARYALPQNFSHSYSQNQRQQRPRGKMCGIYLLPRKTSLPELQKQTVSNHEMHGHPRHLRIQPKILSTPTLPSQV